MGFQSSKECLLFRGAVGVMSICLILTSTLSSTNGQLESQKESVELRGNNSMDSVIAGQTYRYDCQYRFVKPINWMIVWQLNSTDRNGNTSLFQIHIDERGSLFQPSFIKLSDISPPVAEQVATTSIYVFINEILRRQSSIRVGCYIKFDGYLPAEFGGPGYEGRLYSSPSAIERNVVSAPLIMGANDTALTGERPYTVGTTLNCSADAVPAPQYHWYRLDGQPLTGYSLTSQMVDSAYVIPRSWTHSSDGLIACRATNYLGSDSRVFHVRVLLPPEVTTSSVRVAQALGYTAYLHCNVKTSSPSSSLQDSRLNFYWLVNDTRIGYNLPSVTERIVVRQPITNRNGASLTVLEIHGVVVADYSTLFSCYAQSSQGVDHSNIRLISSPVRMLFKYGPVELEAPPTRDRVYSASKVRAGNLVLLTLASVFCTVAVNAVGTLR